jgi:hypothetical protein
MNEEKIKGMEFGETVADGNGNKYTKTIGGWIYSTFAGYACFIPERTEEGATVRKNRTTEK